jgi:TatD DNase family protein
MIDTHAHVHDKAFDDDRNEMIARARAAGVSTMLTVGCDLEDSRKAITCAQTHSGEVAMFASVGIHPHEAKDAPEDIAAAFAPLLTGALAIAIGETGLDYFHNHSPHDAQARVLRAQIRIAQERSLPLIFHQRDAFDDFVAILREEFANAAGAIKGVIHCFTGNPDQARIFVNEFGLKLGIGGVLTFKTAEPLREAVREVGIDHLILETDCPYLAPIPHRGKRNEPAFMLQTATKLAELLRLPLEHIVASTDQTARGLFWN